MGKAGDEVKLVLPYPPTSNHRLMAIRGRLVKSPAAREYAARVRWIALSQKATPLDGEVSVAVSAFRPRRSGDLDNVLKIALDAVKGVAWHDDSQVVELHAYRFEDKADPRLVVVIEKAHQDAEAGI